MGANSRLGAYSNKYVLCFRLLEYSIDCIVLLFSPSNSWFANTEQGGYVGGQYN